MAHSPGGHGRGPAQVVRRRYESEESDPASGDTPTSDSMASDSWRQVRVRRRTWSGVEQMQTLERVSAVVGRWFALIVVVAGGVALLAPETFAAGAPAVPWLLAVIMLGMGMTLRAGDFVVVARRPWALLLGVAAQYVVMPLIGYGLAVVLGLSPELAAGMVLVGSAPGGTASNVMVYLSRGDTALSVAMTTVSTLLAPLLTPLLVLLLADEFLPVDAGELFVSIVQIVVRPGVVGLDLGTAVPVSCVYS